MRFYHNTDEIILNIDIDKLYSLFLSYSTYLNNVVIYNKLMVLSQKICL